MKEKYIILLMIFPLYLGISQDKQINGVYIDSLLLEGKFSAFLITWEKLSKATEILDISQEDVISYNRLSENLCLLSTANKDSLRERCKFIKESYLILNAEHRGEKSNIERLRFLAAIENQQYFEAWEYYYATIYFNNKYIQSEKKRLLMNYMAAQEHFSNGRFDDALSMIRTYEVEEPSNPAFIILRDSLNFLYAELKKNTNASKARLELESENNGVTKRFTISASMDYVIYQETDDPRMVFHHRTYSDLDVYVGHFPEENHVFYKLQAEYFLNSTLSLGLRLAFGTMHDFTLAGVGQELSFTQRIYSLGVIGKYFLENIFIVRPYVCLEAGLINIKRDKVELSPSNFWYPEYNSSISGIDDVYPQITVEIGSEYNFGEKNLFHIGVHIFLSNNYGDTKVIQHLNNGGGLQVGINIF